CGDCPLAARCEARRLGRPEEIPARTPTPATTFVQEAAVVVRQGPRVLLAQRPEGGRWAGLWEFPHGPLRPGETHEDCATRLLGELAGLEGRVGPELLTVRHGITRYQITMVCFEAAYAGGAFRSAFYRRGLWLAPEELPAYPVSAPQRRLARALSHPGHQRRLFRPRM